MSNVSNPLAFGESLATPGARAMGRGERLVCFALLAVLLALRAAFVYRMPIDSDESQHLHVAWLWIQGRLPYRDFFDNHAPLFHILTAPFVALVGERAEILYLARFAMFPLFVTTLGLVFVIGRRLFDARVGAWAALLLGFHAEFFATSLEYRTDDLWIVAWLAGVAVLLGGRWSLRRGFAGGLVLGFALGVSMKTSFLAATLGGGVLVALAVCPAARVGVTVRHVLTGAATVVGGMLVIPATIVVAFASVGVFDALVYATTRHNAMTLGSGGWRPYQHALLAGAVGAVVAAAAVLGRSRWAPGDRARQLAYLASGGIAAALLFTVWPTSTRQDGLPLLVVAALGVSSALVPALDRLGARIGRVASPGAGRRLAIGALVLVAAAFATRTLLRPMPGNPPEADVRDLREVLRLTDRTDFVMDAKGDAVFRERPFYYVLELFTIHRIKHGTIEDRIVERCVATGTTVMFGDFQRYPPATKARLLAAFVGTGRLRIAGAVLGEPTVGAPMTFDLLVPSRYAVIAESGPPVRGTLDGAPYEGPRVLEAGPHTFVPAESGGRLAVLWAKAAERGFSPFTATPPHP
jgi:hypothetical protein